MMKFGGPDLQDEMKCKRKLTLEEALRDRLDEGFLRLRFRFLKLGSLAIRAEA